MRWSGPRMVLYHTLAAVKHLLGENIYMKIEFAMNKNIIFFALLTMLSACTGKANGKRQANVGNNQNVMILNIGNFKWTRQPESCVIKGDTIEVVTKPGTDLWQRTYYLFRNDNAPVFQMETEEKFFSFVVKTDFTESHHRFDQCGIVMYLDSENWLKGSVEYENEEFQHLGSVVTNNGYSDWATTAIPANVKTMWYRLSRREADYCIECSQDGQNFTQMRVCHMHKGSGKIRFGIYACSPEESSFKAVFTDMNLSECAWQAHDGQQPD